MNFSRHLLLPALSLALGCAEPVRAHEADGAHHHWHVAYIVIDDDRQPLPDADRPARITFFAGGTLAGRFGCNRYTGLYRTDGTTIEFGPVAGTKMLCPPDTMATEREVLNGLDAAETVERDGSDMVLRDADGTVVLRLTRENERLSR